MKTMEILRRFRVQLIIIIVALAVIALVLLGQQSPLGEGLLAPSAGGQYVEGLIGRPGRYNPLLDSYNQVDRDVNRLIFSSLFKFDTYGAPQADLVDSWGVSVTGEIVNIRLREDARWHDGAPVTARDVLFTIQLMRFPDAPIPKDVQALWAQVEVVVFDDINMQFVLPEPYAPFMDYLDFGVLPEHLLGGKDIATLVTDPYNLAPVGSGPYKFEEVIVTGDRITDIVLTANGDYYGGGPLIQQIVFRYFDSTAEALTAYKEGRISGIGQIDADTLVDVLNEPNLNVHTARLPRLSLVVFNLANENVPYFRNARVREALYMALNRPWMAAEALHGQALLADGPILPGSWAYYAELPRIDFDPDGAITILRQEGYVIPANGGAVRELDGIRMAFELAHPDTVEHAALAEMIREYWAAIGVQVTLVAVDYETLLEDYLSPRAFEAVLVDYDMTGSPDPDPYPFWHQSQIAEGQNYSGWDDRRASEYLEKARVSTFGNERLRLYRNFQVHFVRELPALPLYFPVYNYAITREIQGVTLGALYDPSDRFNQIASWFLVAGVPAEEIAPDIIGVTPEATP